MEGRTVGGIDEAGLGPMLGPLCFGFCSFTLPGTCDLWDALAGVVAKDRSREGSLRVADSKKVYPGAGGLRRLEETALAFHKVLHGRLPETVEEFLGLSPLGSRGGELDRHPWYRNRNIPLPRRADPADLRLQGDRLSAALERAGIEIRCASVRVVPEGELNDSFRVTGNKAATHFAKCGEAIRWLVREQLREGGEIWVDRHGMRRRYAPLLASLLPQAQIWILRESPRQSSYRIEAEGGSLDIRFVEKGEDRSFPVALASIFAKYARELLMERWNEYFSKVAPGVRRTAGYVADARRYLREAKAPLEAARIAMGILIRDR